MRLPSLACDYFQLTATEGAGTGESFRRYPIGAGEYVLADRGYSAAVGQRRVALAGAFSTMRVNTKSLPLGTPQCAPSDLLTAARGLLRAGQSGGWPVAPLGGRANTVVGRVCALRKTAEAIRVAHKALRRKASKKGKQLQPRTVEFSTYVILFTTFPEDAFQAAAVLEWYRRCWQLELVFKHFKSLAQLGRLPKHADERARA